MKTTAKEQKSLNLEGYDLYSIESPVYRLPSKEGWIAGVLTTQKDFSRHTRQFKSRETPWDSPTNYTPDAFADFSDISSILRQRDKEKELKVVRSKSPDLYSLSRSLRSYGAQHAISRFTPDSWLTDKTGTSIKSMKTRMYPKSLELEIVRPGFKRGGVGS
jgi:hypothetical protein